MRGAAWPRAPRRPHLLEAQGEGRTDDWYWLRDWKDPAVRLHLTDEQAYAKQMLAPLATLRDRLLVEFRRHVPKVDLTVPRQVGPWLYWSASGDGDDFPRHYRRPLEGGTEQLVLDENELAAGHEFFALADCVPSPSHDLLAYSVDETGSEAYALRLSALPEGRELSRLDGRIAPGIVWSPDGAQVFSVQLDDRHRPFRVRQCPVSGGLAEVIYEEVDPRRKVSVVATRSGSFLQIRSETLATSEVLLLDLDEFGLPFRVVVPRASGHRYWLEHSEGLLIMLTNGEGARNFKLVAATLDDALGGRWTPLVTERQDTKLEAMTAFDRCVAVVETVNAVQRVRIVELAGGGQTVIEGDEPVFQLRPTGEAPGGGLLVEHESLGAPRVTFAYDTASSQRTTLKRQWAASSFDPSDYEVRRIQATARDGARPPLSLVYRPDAGAWPRPTVLHAYGAYGSVRDMAFSTTRLSLLDRGIVYAVAHVRGGGELGERWHREGSGLHKAFTFADLIACAEHLLDAGFTVPGRLVLRGESAGGLAVGAVLNERPDLLRAAVAEVPFVDCLTTLLDEALPLTLEEHDEWGDPVRDARAYRAIRSYSPYDRVTLQRYPRLLVTAALHDTQVPYWEPAKWVQKLRHSGIGGGPVVLLFDPGCGHAGPSGQGPALQREATILAFLLDALDLTSRSDGDCIEGHRPPAVAGDGPR